MGPPTNCCWRGTERRQARNVSIAGANGARDPQSDWSNMEHHIWTIRRVALISLFVIVAPGRADEHSTRLWDKLPSGPHAVGYKASWQLDYSRRYDMSFDEKTVYGPGKAPRPVLVNVWYPAKNVGDPKPMTHRQYLNIQSADPPLAKFSSGLSEYNRAIIVKEVVGKPAVALTNREKGLLAEFLDTPTACVRDAAPATGAFPLVIYHAGAGSSFEDNSQFCEFLASYGFVVFGSAFQEPTGKSFNTDCREASVRDLGFLIAYARELPNVDWGHVGIVGHSAGAQAALLFGAQADRPADAIVSLDTTQDYHGLTDSAWQDFTVPVVKNSKNFTCPLLMVAGPNAIFELADSLCHCRRYYLTVKGLAHNEYIAQGSVHKERLYQLGLNDTSEPAASRAAKKAALERVRAEYQAICMYILQFLEAELKGNAAAKDYLAKQYRDTRLGEDAAHVEHVPAGCAGPDAYKGNSPPTPRQLRRFLREQGIGTTIVLLKRLRKEAPASPIYYPIFQLNLVKDLLDEGKTRDAVALRDYYRESGLDCGKLFLQFAKGFERAGATAQAANYYKRVVGLEPLNGEAATKLKEMTERRKQINGR
jgi:dienelactone hydrolase